MECAIHEFFVHRRKPDDYYARFSLCCRYIHEALLPDHVVLIGQKMVVNDVQTNDIH